MSQQKTNGLADTLKESTKEATEKLETFFGENMGKVFETIDRALLQPGYGGLEDVHNGVAASISEAWMEELKELKKEGEVDSVPDAFIVRRCSDGSLFLKSVYLPKGLVLHGARMESSSSSASVATTKSDVVPDPQLLGANNSDEPEKEPLVKTKKVKRNKVPTEGPGSPGGKAPKRRSRKKTPAVETSPAPAKSSSGKNRRSLDFNHEGEIEAS